MFYRGNSRNVQISQKNTNVTVHKSDRVIVFFLLFELINTDKTNSIVIKVIIKCIERFYRNYDS